MNDNLGRNLDRKMTINDLTFFREVVIMTLINKGPS